MPGKREYLHPVTLIFFFIAGGFALYYPIISNTFLSDDYDSLHRIIIEKRILYKEFLRPMIDISFYFNYLISGLSAGSYYLFNITVHIINVLLLFRFTLKLQLVSSEYQYLAALFAASLFLVYPFHNESIAWLSGRLSSMACLFALLSLIIANERKGTGFLLLSIMLYLAGMLCYESILFLPVIIIVLNWHTYKSKSALYRDGICWTVAACIYPLARRLISGEITGEYGSRVTDHHLLQKMINIAKVSGRLFLPPSGNQLLLTGLTILLILSLMIIHWKIFSKSNQARFSAVHYSRLLAALLISLVIPFAFGVSTRTSEGDRLLYFPSALLCILVASWMIALCSNRWQRWVWAVLVGSYFICFLELNNRHWVKASDTAAAVMHTVQAENRGSVVFINMPDEWEGAFIFRNGFRKALAVNNIEENRVKVFNYLKRDEYLKAAAIIEPVIDGAAINLFPGTHIVIEGEKLLHISSSIDSKAITAEKNKTLIYYWDKDKMVRLF